MSKGKKKAVVLRAPTLPKGDVHWLPRMPGVVGEGRYACKKKIRRFNFSKDPEKVTCKGCVVVLVLACKI